MSPSPERIGAPRRPRSRRETQALIAIIVVATAGRIGLALRLPAEATFPDGERYIRIAQSIVTQGVFPPSEEESAPLHPVLMALLFAVVGKSVVAARVMTALFGGLTCALVYALGRRLFDPAAGLIAAALLALYPLHVYTSALFEYPTTLFIFLLCATLVAVVELGAGPTALWRWAGAGLVLALAALAVPTVLTAAPFLAVWLLCRPVGALRPRAVRVAVMTAACAAPIAVWSGYWYHLTGTFQLISGAGAETFFKGNCALAWKYGKADIADIYEKEGVPPDEQHAYDEYMAVEREARKLPSGSQRDRFYHDAAMRFITERPRDAALLFARKAGLYWLPYAKPVTRSAADSSATRVVQFATFTPIAVLAFAAVIVHRRLWKTLFVLYAVIVTQWLTYTSHLVAARYRLQIDPILIVLAAAVVAAIVRAMQTRASRAHAGVHVDVPPAAP